MRNITSYLKALIRLIKNRTFFNNKFAKIVYLKEIEQYITFCGDCGEYICADGLCSNPICPHEIR